MKTKHCAAALALLLTSQALTLPASADVIWEPEPVLDGAGIWLVVLLCLLAAAVVILLIRKHKNKKR